MKKKKLHMLVIGCLFFSLMLTGCNNNLSDKLNNKYPSTESPPEKVTYTITFDANGGTCMVESTTVEQNQTIGQLPQAERNGHTFLGWFTAQTDGEHITEGMTISGNTTLYAHWEENQAPVEPEPNQYTITFNPNGGTFENGSTETKTVTENAELGELPIVSKSGNNFVGWFTVNSTTGGEQAMPDTIITANTTYYARWQAIPTVDPTKLQYRVTLNANGGTCTTGDITVQKDSTYSGLPTPTRTGYNFAGWYTMVVGGDKKQNGDSLAANAEHNLYARWTNKTYTVKYNMKGGNESFKDITKKHDVAVYLSSVVPTKNQSGGKYYEFEGWYNPKNDKTYQAGAKYNATGDTTLEAKWKEVNTTPATYEYVTITFNKDGGTNLDKSSSAKIKKGNALKQLPIPIKSGYIFQGWYDGNTKVTASTTFNESKTITAKWTATKNTHLDTYIYVGYLETVYYDELCSAPSSEGFENLSKDSESSIKRYMRNSGINKGWRGSGAFDPDYFANYILKTYGYKFTNYKDAWEVAIGDIESEYYMLETRGNCQHIDKGTHNCNKTATHMDFVQAVLEEKLLYIPCVCSCGQIFESYNDWHKHRLQTAQNHEPGHAGYSDGNPVYEYTVVTPARIDYIQKTYCTNTQKELSSKIIKTEPWTGEGSGMP